MALSITSSAFAPNSVIPSRYTCDGDDINPPLAWSGAPAGTKSYVLIYDDPDAPVGTWDHWILFNIPIEVATIAENSTPKAFTATFSNFTPSIPPSI